MTALRNALLSLFFALCCLLTYRCLGLVDRAATVLESSQQAIVETRLRVVQTSQNTNAVLLQLGEASNQWRLASMNQATYAAKLEKTLDNADGLVSDARHAVQTLDREVSENGKASQKAIQELQGTASTASAVLGRLDALAVALGPAVEDVGRSAKNAGDASASMASAAGHVDRTSAEAEEAMGYLRDSLKPTKQSFWSRVIWMILGKGLPQTVRSVGK